MKYLISVILFSSIFFVAPILAQSIPRPVAGTRYAPVYVKETREFIGWEGVDGTFVTPLGGFYSSVTYQQTEVSKGAYLYEVMFNIETFEILYFTVGDNQYSVDGFGLPSMSFSDSIVVPDVTYDPFAEDYPMPPSGKDENGMFTQRIFIHIYPDVPYGDSSVLDSYLNGVFVNGEYRQYNYTTYVDIFVYIGAGVCQEYCSYLLLCTRLLKGRAVVVTDKGEVCAKDGFELLTVSLSDSGSSTAGFNDNNSLLVKVVSLSHSEYIVTPRTTTGGTPKINKTVYGYRYNMSTSNSYFLPYGKCSLRVGSSFYYRDQYGKYVSASTIPGVYYEDRDLAAKATVDRTYFTFHKSKGDYEIWYFDRKYYAAGYNNSNSDSSGSDGSPPTLPSPPTELSEFTYFSKDEEGNYHLKIDEVLKEFKTKLKEKYKFNFLGVGDEISDDSVGDFQSGLESSIEEVNSAEPLTFNIEHRFDIVKGNFREPSIQVSDTELVFDYQKWFDVEILHVIRSIILFVLCVEFFFMTLKLFV
jgi:hypothetical protein